MASSSNGSTWAGRLGTILALVGLAALCVFSFREGVKFGRNAQQGGIAERADTTYVRDTIRVPYPVYSQRQPEVRVDTLCVHDTLLVPVPIERRVYADSNYRAVVSGWHPCLEEISVYPTTKVITRQVVQVRKERTRWGVGVQVGVGVTGNGLAVPYVGAGVSYNIFSW